MAKLERLAQLAKKKTLFDDRPVEVEELTFVRCDSCFEIEYKMFAANAKLGHQTRSRRTHTSPRPITRSLAQRTSQGLGQGTTRSSRSRRRARQERGSHAKRASRKHDGQLAGCFTDEDGQYAVEQSAD